MYRKVDMAQFEIIVGSVLGASEYVAEAIEQVLLEKHHQTKVHLSPELTEINLNTSWIICTSTHGAGDLPDNIQAFATALATQDLSNTEFVVVGLGDSSYDTFCYGAEKIEQALLQQGAKQLHPSLHIDVLNHPIPEEVAVEWLNGWLTSGN